MVKDAIAQRLVVLAGISVGENFRHEYSVQVKDERVYFLEQVSAYKMEKEKAKNAFR